LSPDLDVVFAGIFFGPSFLVSLVFTPAAFLAACVEPAAPLPGPPFTSAFPGLVGDAFTLPFG
jgi:hypothetical protein